MEIRNRKSNILVIDDDVTIGNMLEELLTREGYGVMRAYSGTEAVLLMEHMKWYDSDRQQTAAKRGRSLSAIDSGMEEAAVPDLILLDLMLPGISGENLLAKLSGIPVIVVSARAGIDDKVQLLMNGAADYITKPFECRELLARVAVQLRKTEDGVSTLPQELKTGSAGEDILQCGSIGLSLAMHTVTIGEQTVRLTKTEYAILKVLMENPTQVVTKSALLDRISMDTPDCMESSLKVHISNLRRKLREAGGLDSDGEYIESIWGIGFKMKKS